MKKKKFKKVTHRIPYDYWINSPLSIARHWGECKLNNKNYVFDPDCVYGEDGNGNPDLVTYE